VGEVIVGGSALVERARHNPAVSIRVPPDGLEGGAEDRPTPNFVDPFASSATSSPPKLIATAPKPQAPPAATPMQVASLPQPTPVPEKLVSLPESRLDALIAEARALRQRGDTSTAITRLREALTMSPKSPLVMTELATTFEKMGLEDKALEQYHNVYDLGDSAGIYYELADAKIKAAQAPSPAVAQTSPGATSGAPAHDDVGFQPGSSLALVSLSTVEKPDTVDGYKQFTLKIPVKRRPDTKINVSGVVIQVFFYDQLGNGNIVRTNANVSSKWSSLPADWVGNDIEILDVDYTQAPPEPGKIEEGRHYYGYIVCVYYNKDLQDQAADPDDLIKQYPPPLTLPDQ
jgi:tetratricopeptide (TPR) repeat protein